ncbi:hypothetical protein LTR85_006861 [Meristemomyces frigidus]|nr:hypothetical protein LTR85_006861 [Meristemomyces frigidus]
MRSWLQQGLPVLLIASAVLPLAAATTAYSNTTVVPANLSSTSTSSSSASANVGDYIVQGLGGASSPSSASSSQISSSTASTTLTSSASAISAHQNSSSSATLTPSASKFSAAQDSSSTYLAPITTFSSAALSASFSYAANVSGITEAAQCWSELSSWSVESVSWYNSLIANATYPLTNTSLSLIYPDEATTTYYPSGNVSTYTLCDGSPRANTSPLTKYSSWTSTEFLTYLQASLPTPFRSQPCTPTAEECRILYYDSNLYDYSANQRDWDSLTNSTRIEDDEDRADADGLLRFCGFPAHLSSPCIIAGGPVQLLYFPVDTVGGDLCHANTSNASTIVNTEPQVVTTLGREYTSGSVYLSFSTLYASYDGFWDRVGPTFSDYVMTLQSDDISTHCGGGTLGWDWGPATQINYADWNKPIRADVYNCQKQCSSIAPCSTIWDNFNPWLAVPTVIRSRVPQWSTCSFSDDNEAPLLFDPPRALQPAESAATVTMPSTPTSTTASPSATPTSPQPVQTETTTSQQPTADATAESTRSVVSSSGAASAQQDQSPTHSVSTNGPASGATASTTKQTPTESTPTTQGDGSAVGTTSQDPSSGNSPTSTQAAADPASNPAHTLSDHSNQEDSGTQGGSSSVATSQNTDPASSSADPGGAIASLLGESGKPTTSTQATADPASDPAQASSGSGTQYIGGTQGGSSSEATSQATNPVSSPADTGGAVASVLGAEDATSVDPAQTSQLNSGTSNAPSVLESAATSSGDPQASSGAQAVPSAAQSDSISVAGTTLSVGGPEIVSAGNTLTLGSSGLVLLNAQGTQAVNAAQDQSQSLTGGTSVLTAGFLTLTAAAVEATAQSETQEDPKAQTTVGSHTFSVVQNPSATDVEVVDGSMTVTAGGSIQTIDAQTVSAASGDLVIDGTIVLLTDSSLSTIGETQASGAQVVAASHTFSIIQNPSSGGVDIVDGSITLTAGGSVETVEGQIISAASGVLVIDGSSVALTGASMSTTGGEQTSGTHINTASHTFSIMQDPSSSGVEIVDGSITLTAGGAAHTVDGQTFSAVSGGIIIDGSSTDLTASRSISSDGQQDAQTATTSSTIAAAAESSAPVASSSQTATSSASILGASLQALCLGSLGLLSAYWSL